MRNHNPLDDDRLQQMGTSYRGVYKRAMTGKSRAAAMTAFCYECCGWQRAEVYACTDTGCPLYPYRPTSDVPQDEAEAHQTDVESPNAPAAAPEGLLFPVGV